jgi:hypothetical protein
MPVTPEMLERCPGCGARSFEACQWNCREFEKRRVAKGDLRTAKECELDIRQCERCRQAVERFKRAEYRGHIFCAPCCTAIQDAENLAMKKVLRKALRFKS